MGGVRVEARAVGMAGDQRQLVAAVGPGGVYAGLDGVEPGHPARHAQQPVAGARGGLKIIEAEADDVGEHDGRIYLVSEFLKGQSLRGEAAGRPMHVRRALELAIQIADAVAGAHAAGFVGGGFDPDSITVTTRGHAKIPVFDPAARSGLDQHGSVARHRDYDSPEELDGKPPDERSDIYSVGAILYEMLTTRRPVHRGSAAPSAANRHVPAVVDQIVLKAVAPNADRRMQSAAELAAELRAAAATPEVRGDEEDAFGDAEQPTNRLGQVLMLTTVILLGLGLLLWWLVAS